MRRPLHPSPLGSIVERRPRRPLPTPGWTGALPRYGFVIAVVTAHDAEHRLAATLEALDAQTRRPDAVVVVADRCTDATVVTALVHGATVVETNDNAHGCDGALDLALREVLAMVDDDDVILMLPDGAVPTPTVVADALGTLWHRPTPRRHARLAAATPTGLVVTNHGSPGTGWPGGPGWHTNAAGVALAGALRAVATARADSDAVLALAAEDAGAELVVAMEAAGYAAVTTDAGHLRSHSCAAHPLSHHYRSHRRTQHATLLALGTHGTGRHTRRSVRRQVRVALEVTLPVVTLATLATTTLTGGPLILLAGVLAIAAVTWGAERSIAHRHFGRRLPTELVRGLGRAAAAGAGVVAGTWRWLAGLRLRQRVWRHPRTGRMLARQPAPFPTAAALSLVRIPGAAIAIERSGPLPEIRVERWRRMALGGCAAALAAVVVVGLPVLAPLPATAVVATWAMVTAAVSTARLGTRAWRRHTRG